MKVNDYIIWSNIQLVGQITNRKDGVIWVRWKNINHLFKYNLAKLTSVEKANLRLISKQEKLELL